VRLLRFDRPDAPTNEQATAHLRITVKDADPKKVRRRFSGAAVEPALVGYAGFHTTTPPGSESAFGVYWPTTDPAFEVWHVVVRLRTSNTSARSRVNAKTPRPGIRFGGFLALPLGSGGRGMVARLKLVRSQSCTRDSPDHATLHVERRVFVGSDHQVTVRVDPLAVVESWDRVILDHEIFRI
jgi:hypothetical protein